ncbi:AfsR/SARP family transcriptional regulator [Streptomyces abyssomicinicus]|uniref:AfsR/SARP family transcriptional regulator n=1 Tax=Streptomyces abyssomicinicus TaxID=574929 RepID=UPI00124FA584|nr:BTAD domain-containing putative transcriptional regulator [Streptomyces abyssomicinicus]
MNDTRFRVLGPIGLSSRGLVHRPRTPQQRTVLATLLLTPGRVVPAARLVTALWGEDPPSTARNSVQVQISRLRQFLKQHDVAELITSSSGYALEAEPDLVDLHRFRQLVRAAQAAHPATAVDLLERALDEWSGPPLADAAGDWLATTMVPVLEEERLGAVELLAELALEAGRHDHVVRALMPLHPDHPLRERLSALLITALHRSGRRADALQTYRRVREQFIAELGLEPGEELQRAHIEVLGGEAGTGRPTSTPPFAPSWATPCQLPPGVEHFAGRRAEMAQLQSHLDDFRPGLGTSPLVCLITGMGGVGKSALAVRWCLANRQLFPDGQLHLDLRGFGPDDAPVAPNDAVRTILESLGVPAMRIPATFDARVGLFRSLLADRRMIIVLDNARDSEQVRSLIPGSPGSLVVVTSRNVLSDIMVGHGARLVTLDPFTAEHAGELITRRLEHTAATPERATIQKITNVCGGLPLALNIVLAQVIAHSQDLALLMSDDMIHPEQRLEAFSQGEGRSNLEAVFSWSFRSLTPESGRLFRLLGMHVNPEITLAAAASFLGADLSRARRAMSELVRSHLINPLGRDRFVVHDLVWAYARKVATTEIARADKDAARQRALEHYLHSAMRGDLVLNPFFQIPLPVPSPGEGVTVCEFTDSEAVSDWFHAERRALTSAVEESAESGSNLTWQFARAVRTYFYRYGRLPEQARMHELALAAARRSGEALPRAYSHFGLGQAFNRLGRFAESRDHLEQALGIYRDADEAVGVAVVETELSVLSGQQGENEEALAHSLKALEVCRLIGHGPGEAMALNNAGWYEAQLGELTAARDDCAQAYVLFERLGDPMGAAAALDSLAFVHRSLGEPDQAVVHYQKALRMRAGHELIYEAETLAQLAEAQLLMGSSEEALGSLRRAISLFRNISPADASRVEARLAELETLITSS